jgi:hypothetical protein
MSATVELRTTLTVAEAMRAVKAMAHEWRESMLPAALRNRSIFRISVTIDRSSFTLQSRWGWRSPYRPQLVGVVRPDTDSRGSIICVTTKPTAETRVSGAMWLATVLAVAWLVRYRITPPELAPFQWVPAFAFVALGFAMYSAMYTIGRRFSASERLGLLTLLATTIQAEPSVADSDSPGKSWGSKAP